MLICEFDWSPQCCAEFWFCPVKNLKPFHWESESSDKKMSYIEITRVNGMKCRGKGRVKGTRVSSEMPEKEYDLRCSG